MARKPSKFIAPNGKRKTIRLGAVPERIADFIKFRIEALLSYIIAGGTRAGARGVGVCYHAVPQEEF